MERIDMKTIYSDTKENWESEDLVYAQGIMLYENDTRKIKISDGEHSYTELGYLLGEGSGGGDVPSGDYVTNSQFKGYKTEVESTYLKKEDAQADYVTNEALEQEYDTADETEEKVDEKLKSYIPVTNTEKGNTSYMANEADGGIMKLIRSSDKQYSKIGLWNDESEGAGLQLVTAIDKGGNGSDENIIKIEGTKNGMYYARHGGSCSADEEIAVKGDLKEFAKKEELDTTYVKSNELSAKVDELGYIKNADLGETYVQVAELDSKVSEAGFAKSSDLEATYATKSDLSEKASVESVEAKADKTELAKYIPINVKEGDDTAYMANEKDGGLIKLTTSDKGYAKVSLCKIEEQAVAQIVATDETKETFAKIDARKDGICYSKKIGNPNIEEDELVVKKDLKVYTPAEMEGLNHGDTAVCHNAKDGGSIKYMTETHTAFVGVDNGGDELFAEFALAENKQGKEFKKGNRLLAKKDGIFYTKDANSTTTTPEDEIITKKDITNFITEDAISEKADKADLEKYTETKLIGDNGTALIFNEKDGGGVKFIANNGVESFVGVNDGKEIEGLYAQIYCDKPIDGGKWQGAKIDITNEKIYYTVGSDNWATRKKDENEIATVKLINELKQKILDLTSKVEQLEAEKAG